MKVIANAKGYALKFHPSRPLAFALPNSAEVGVISTETWKPICKLAKLKYPREVSFTDDSVVVSGFEGHIGVYGVSDFTCEAFFKAKNATNDNWGLFVHSDSQHLALASMREGVLWIDYKSQESRNRFQPDDDLGFAPITCYVHRHPAPDRFVTLCKHFRLQKGEGYRQSTAHVWSVHEEKPLQSFNVLPKPSKQEFARQCCIGIDNTLLVSTNYGNRLLGWDLDTGELVFDNPKLTHGGQTSEVVCAVMSNRRLIAVGSNGFIDFWNSNLSELVYQFDSGKREGYGGDLTVSPDEKYLACCVNGMMQVYELPESLQGK